jgi:hypothetical protein
MLVAAATANGQSTSTGYNGYRHSERVSYPGNPNGSFVTDYPAAEVQEATRALADVAAARMAYERAVGGLCQSRVQVERDFENSGEMTVAVGALKQAYEAWQQARREALAPLAENRQYQELLLQQHKLAGQIGDLHNAAGADCEAIGALAKAKLEAAAAAGAMEAAALKAGGKAERARTKLMAAASKVSEMRRRLGGALHQDQRMVEGRQAVEETKGQWMLAKAYCAAAIHTADVALDYAYYLHRADGHPLPYHVGRYPAIRTSGY